MLLEKALESCTSQEGIELDPHERKKLREQRMAIEAQLSNVRQQLVETSRVRMYCLGSHLQIEMEIVCGSCVTWDLS